MLQHEKLEPRPIDTVVIQIPASFRYQMLFPSDVHVKQHERAAINKLTIEGVEEFRLASICLRGLADSANEVHVYMQLNVRVRKVVIS